jgi:hypothetical protein
MALPPRLTLAARSVLKASRVLSPTGLGVLLSVGAHALLFGLAPQTSFSFASLTQAAQEAKAEETIVPLTTLSPAERNRLPSFAQPRGLSTAPTGLSNLPLPSGLPFIPRADTLPRRQVPANTMPSATTKAPTTGNLGALRNSIPANRPFRLNLPATTPPARSPGSPPPVAVITQPTPPPPANAPTTTPSPNNNGDLPDLSPGSEAAPSNGMSTAEVLAGLEAAGNADNGQATPNENTPETAPTEETETTDIPVETSGETSESPLLASNNLYDEANVSEADADQNLAKWLEGKGDVLRGVAEMPIDSGFKACREQPPADGRLGVVVNPDGSREAATVLKSTGYEMLNRLALSTLEYQTLAPAEAPMYYEVEVKVTYEPTGCAEGTATESPEGAPAESPEAIPDFFPQ